MGIKLCVRFTDGDAIDITIKPPTNACEDITDEDSVDEN